MVYSGLSTEDIGDIEKLALDRSRFSRDCTLTVLPLSLLDTDILSELFKGNEPVRHPPQHSVVNTIFLCDIIFS